MKNLRNLWVFALGVLLVACSSNPTNAPSQSEVDESNKTRAAAIDNDPSLTPEQKNLQKQMLGLTPGGRPTRGPAPK
jgi:hypothetical protein